MNALQLTALVCLALVLGFAGLFGIAWCWDRWMRRDHRADPALRRLIWINALQIGLCCLFGVVIGYAYFHCWSQTWRP